MMSIINSIVALWETFMYSAQVEAIELTDQDEMQPPIFILGRVVEQTHTHARQDLIVIIITIQKHISCM